MSGDLVIPDPTDAAWPKWAGYAIVGAIASYYIAKMEEEIARIESQSGTGLGYMYSLTASVSGSYPVMTWSFNLPTSTTPMNAGDVWKYGQTSSSCDRYSASELKSIGPGVTENILLYGNKVQIKVAEKVAIYSYFLKEGHLPPGNKIFR